MAADGYTKGKRGLRGIACLLAWCLLAGCGGPVASYPPAPLPVENPAEVNWSLNIGGLHYFIETTDDLNMDKGFPLGLTVCLYQLADYATLQNLASTPAGLSTLLEGNMETAGALSVRTFALQPGQRIEVTADRMEKARYLAVVAGYTHLKPELCWAILPFPLHTEREGLLRKPVYLAAPVDALIRLGSESVSLSGVERVR